MHDLEITIIDIDALDQDDFEDIREFIELVRKEESNGLD